MAQFVATAFGENADAAAYSSNYVYTTLREVSIVFRFLFLLFAGLIFAFFFSFCFVFTFTCACVLVLTV
jgi:hypothetical protein